MSEDAHAQIDFQESRRRRTFLMAACFVALVATSFAFIIRVMCMEKWQVDFGLSETQKGEIFGAGMWPFGLSIVLFSLIIDRVGYGRSMIFAFVCHAASAVMMMTAKGYWALYWGSILNGLAAGTVEAVINPAIASVYPKQKTKMLTMLHAGWPGGFVLGGILILLLDRLGISWRVNVTVILVPTLAYGLMLLRAKFPVSERVAAGVSYRDMLREAGALGCLIVLYMIMMEVNRVAGLAVMYDGAWFDLPHISLTIVMAVLVVAYLLYTHSLGRPLYIFLLFIMILLAITELGTDTWIKELMKPAMEKLGLNSGLVLVYTATIMMVLRFCIGPIERRLKPLGVLFVSSVLAAAGLYFLSRAEGVMILVMATIYGTGQCFFWPVTLGLVSERFPKGGALTLNAIAGVGMLGVGIVGSQMLGFWQDTSIEKQIKAEHPDAYVRLMDEKDKHSIFGAYRSLDDKQEKKIAYLTALHAGPAKTDAGGKEYRTVVRRAYDLLARPEGDTSEMSHEAMLAALKAKGFMPNAKTAAQLEADMKIINDVRAVAKRDAMSSVAVLPLIMAVCYLGLIIYFKAQGGYKAVDLMGEEGGGGEAAASAEDVDGSTNTAEHDNAKEEASEG